MRSRVLLLTGVVVLLLASIFVGASSAHTFVKDTSLSIGKVPSGDTAPGDQVLVHGRLKPAACRAQQRIALVNLETHSVLKTDKTDAQGEYSFTLHPKHDMRVRARFGGSVETSYGHSHTCNKSKSSILHIQVS